MTSAQGFALADVVKNTLIMKMAFKSVEGDVGAVVFKRMKTDALVLCKKALIINVFN